MFHTILEIVEDIKQGKIVIVLDDERENEGDMVVAAQFATPDTLRFMTKYGCGIICMPMAKQIIENLELELQPRRYIDNLHNCLYTVSIDARHGIGSGISAEDRATTIQAAVQAVKDDIKTPGHIFPILAHDDGVLGRIGHTEASVDIVKLAGLTPAAVLTEVMDENRDAAAAYDELLAFAKRHQIKICKICDLVAYRKAHLL